MMIYLSTNEIPICVPYGFLLDIIEIIYFTDPMKKDFCTIAFCDWPIAILLRRIPVPTGIDVHQLWFGDALKKEAHGPSRGSRLPFWLLLPEFGRVLSLYVVA